MPQGRGYPPYQQGRRQAPTANFNQRGQQPRRWSWTPAIQNAITTGTTLAGINPWLGVAGAVGGFALGGFTGPHAPRASDYAPMRQAWQNYMRGARNDLRQGVNAIGRQASQRQASQGLYGSPLGQSIIQHNQNYALQSGLNDINRNRYQFEAGLAGQQMQDQRAYDQQIQNQWAGVINNAAYNTLPLYNKYFRPDPVKQAKQKALSQRFDRLENPSPNTRPLPTGEAFLEEASRDAGLAMMGVQPPNQGTPVQSAPGVTMAGPNAPEPKYQAPPGGDPNFWQKPDDYIWGQDPSRPALQPPQEKEGESADDAPTPEQQVVVDNITPETHSPEQNTLKIIDPVAASEIEQFFGDPFADTEPNYAPDLPGLPPQSNPSAPGVTMAHPDAPPNQQSPPNFAPPPQNIFPSQQLLPDMSVYDRPDTSQRPMQPGMPQIQGQEPSQYHYRDLPLQDLPYLMERTVEQLRNYREAVRSGIMRMDFEGQGDTWERRRLEKQLALINKVSDRKRRQAERRAQATATALGGLEQLGDRGVASVSQPTPPHVVDQIRDQFGPGAFASSAYTSGIATDLIKFGEGPMLKHPHPDPTKGYNIGWGRSVTENGLDIQSEIIPILRGLYPTATDNLISAKLKTIGKSLRSEGRVRLSPKQVRNLFPNGINTQHATMLLENDMYQSEQDLIQVLGVSVYAGLDAERQAVLLDMMHTLGRNKFSKFVNMIDAVQKGEWYRAGYEMRNSLWYSQVKGRRANPLIRKMMGADYQSGDIRDFTQRMQGR